MMNDEIKIIDIIDMRLGNNRTGLQDFINFIKKFHDTKELTLLEIGSFKGESSEMFAQEFKEVTCVDSWIGKSVEMFLKTCTPTDIENEFDRVVEKYKNIIKIKGDSIEISKILDKTFDVVYIDAAHDYVSVKKDIEVWKNKATLVISGHDYSPKHKGVMKAVNEVYFMPDEKFKDNSWLVWKDRSSKSLQYKYNKNYVLNRIEGKKEFAQGKIHPRKIAIANHFNVKNKVVFDVGFGRGELLKLCYDKGAECYGVDYSKDAYDVAREYINEDIILYFSDFENLNLIEVPEIDILFMIDIIEHISEKEFDFFMEKIKNNLSENVKCFIHTPKDIHAGDIYNMHVTQWTKQMLKGKFSKYFKKIDIKENPGNWYLIGEGKNA
jgi:cyclopropane fatty-acyl-phospholipid synthase-like methyltransferase